MGKIILSADSTCDLGRQLKDMHKVQYLYNRIQLDGSLYIDTQEITPEDVYQAWRQKGILPTTSAITPADYQQHFQPWIDQGYQVVHITIGSGISGGYQNCCIAAQELGNVYPIDSKNLSTGIGSLVLMASRLISQGISAPQVQAEVQQAVHRSKASFLIETLEFMKAGGRCSTVAAFGANLLNLKPCIEVDSQDGGKMHVGKKYRGSMEKCIPLYVRDKLAGRQDIDLSHIFITHSGAPEAVLQCARDEIMRHARFENIYITRANTTISSHCGPGTVGILFMTK